jgi:Domain of unknown function (DUF4178)/Nudix N-terminal
VAVANCPSCGAPVEFKIGGSIVVVCDYCRTVVARGDRAVEDLGKVAALIDTGSPLRRDLPGKYRGVGFRIAGRTQMRHQAGGVWDEWYAAFDDGRWGWLAEAAGKFYVTFTTPAANLPPFDVIAVGGRMGDLVITEVGTAAVISGEGEIPWRVEPGSTYDYADLSGPQGKFATIDYSEETPLFFGGRETSLAELGVDVAPVAGRGQRIKGEKLSCSNCGGPLELIAPDQAQRIICPNCGGVHDIEEGNLRYLEALKQKGPGPRIPLGSKGKIDGTEYVLAGFMQRSVKLDQRYFWTEYLLFNQQNGYRWLVESDHHWSFVWPINAGDVKDQNPRGADRAVSFENRKYRIFGNATARVEYVLGEFYWRVERGEKVRAVDYTAAPFGLSKEITGDTEINYSAARYMQASELERAFNVKGLPRPTTVGMMQPYAGGSPFRTWAALMAVLLVVAIFLAITRSRHEVLNSTFDFSTPAATTSASADSWTDTPKPESSRVIFTAPFTLTGNRNLEIEASAPVHNNWMYVAGDIGDEQQSGLLEPFDLPIEYYEGYDSGEHWSEGSTTQRVFISALPAGTYTMRLEGQWDEKSHPAPVHLIVREGVFRWSHFILAFVLLTIPALLMGFKRVSFETQRWAESQYTAVGTEKESSSDDEE